MFGETFEHTSWLLKCRWDLVVRRLELLELTLLWEWRFLILFILVRVGVAGVCSLVGGIAFVGGLKGNFSYACFVAKECKVSAASPREGGKEAEEDGARDTATTAWWILRLTPLTWKVAEPNKVHEGPEAGEAEIGKDVVFTGLGWWHLLEQILASDEAHCGEEAYETNPDRVATSAAVTVNDAHVFLIVILGVSVWTNRSENNDREYLELKGISITQHPQSDTWWEIIDFSLHANKGNWKVFGEKSKKLSYPTQQTARMIIGGLWMKVIAEKKIEKI